MSVNLSPIGNGINFLTNTGLPLAGGLLYTYQAGSSTPLTTYTTINGTVANSNPIVLGTDGRLPSEMWLTYGYFYKFVLEDANSNLIASYDNIYGILGTVPATSSAFTTGMILLWSGSTGSIPSGFYLCNGSNGTPDLRDRFIVGAGGSYTVAQTGGSADSIVVSHNHTATSVVTDPGHFHVVGYDYGATAGGGGIVQSGSTAVNTSTKTTGITVATTNVAAGTSGTGANNPLYYALAYIMAA
jgi:hypothetical protein